MEKQKRVYVVPHSHWDREWYFTLEDSNVLLVENLDYLLNVLEKDEQFHAYVFDAQVSVVEEYLKIRPDQYDRLQELIKAKRIFIGPWYTQTDTLLVNKESIIRNLLYGTRLAKEMGHSMQIGYLPDVFGQNAYLPSIFQGYGIESSILQRGIYTDQLKNDLNFIWKSPDGQSVKANNIFLGYGPGKFLSADEEYFMQRLLPMLEKLSELNEHTDHLLLPAGGDQVLVRKQFPEIIAELNKKDPNHEYILSDYETFMSDTWKDHRFGNVIEGELLASQKSRIHNTIRSQRYDLKQLNYIVENKILNVLEPLAVIGQSLGLAYPQAWLDQMWKLLFDAHAHDSIGGCNSDDTNHDILARLKKVDRIADGLLNIMKKQLVWAIRQQLGQENILVAFNTLPKIYSGLIESVLFTKEPSFTLLSSVGQPLSFDIVEQSYISGGKKIVVTAEGEKEIEQPGYYRSVVNISVENLPAMGYTSFLVHEAGTDAAILDTSAHPSTSSENTFISNELFQLSFANGGLTLEQKLSGQTLDNFLSFEDTGDAGDSYDYSPLEHDQPLLIRQATLQSLEKGALTQRMTVLYTAILPSNLSGRERGDFTQELKIHTTFELRYNEPFLRVSHTIPNAACDHRLRVRFKTPVVNPSHSHADQGFSIVQRPVVNPYLANWKDNKFAEAPVPIYPLENFVAVSQADATFAVITKGIKEYEVLPETAELALTLFRSVGLLGRDDLQWRPGRASGINNKVVYTPDAQLQQTLQFEYAIHMSGGALQPEQLFSMTDRYVNHRTAYQLQTLNTFEERLERFELPMPIDRLPEHYSLFRIDNDQIFMSMCKLAYEGDGIVIRLFNPTGQPQQTAIASDHFRKFELTNLYETVQCEIEGSVEVPAKGYVTVKLK